MNIFLRDHFKQRQMRMPADYCFCASSTMLIFVMMIFRGNDYFVHSQMKLVDRPTERFNIWIFISWVGGGDRSGAAELSLSGSCTS